MIKICPYLDIRYRIFQLFYEFVSKEMCLPPLSQNQQIRVNETMTFVLNQSQVDIKHPFDLDADQIGGAFTKKQQSSIL